MPEPTLKDRVDCLVRRKFPNAQLLKIGPSLSSMRPAPDTSELRPKVEAYERELNGLTLVQLHGLYEAEKQRETEQLIRKVDAEEKQRFFNHRHAAADFDHWSKAAYWSLDEALALSFGKAPEIVHWKSLQSLTVISAFAQQYSRRRDLALRAVGAKQLTDPVWPSHFLAWAERFELEVPSQLLAAIEKRGILVADWKALYDKAMAAAKEYESGAEGLLEAKDQLILALKSRVDSLLKEKSEQSIATTEKPLSTRERESLLKLVIGMARDSYSYDPTSNRSSVPREIADDLAKHGISMDTDTVRKWLNEAAELLPGK